MDHFLETKSIYFQVPGIGGRGNEYLVQFTSFRLGMVEMIASSRVIICIYPACIKLIFAIMLKMYRYIEGDPWDCLRHLTSYGLARCRELASNRWP